jgi:iron complex outermembrane recepter protein
MKRSSLVRLGVASALVSSLSMGVVSAQEATTAAQQTVDEVVVTGSRIARSDYVAESPIMTIGEEAIENRGPQTLDAMFNQMPQFTASNQGSGSDPSRQGRNNANLRGLGIQRTLVLLDGRRTQPSDALGAVDLNSIAPSLIESVEVITGGASAVYGSDAIAGVVNFKLRRDFEGLELDAQYGETERGDAEAMNFALTFGGNFAEGRGNIIGSLAYYDRDGAFRESRPFFERSGIASVLQGGTVTANAANLPTQAALNSLFISQYGGATPPSRNASFGVNLDGTLFTNQTPILNNRYPEGQPYITDQGRVGYPLGNTLPLIQPLDRDSAFLRGRYEIADNVEVYAQYNHSRYEAEYSRNGWAAGGAVLPLVTIPITNPFVPADMRTLMNSRTNSTSPLNFQFNTARVARTVYDYSYTIDEYLAGVTGKLPEWDLSWDVYASYGETRAEEVSSGWIDYRAWTTLVNAPDGGASVCPGGFNPFLPTTLADDPAQQACVDYMNRTLQERSTFSQEIVEATLQGGLFTLPAGKVRFALGAGYRRQTYQYDPAEQRVRQEVMPNQPTGPADGDYDVKEFFTEFFIPVLKDLPAVDELNLDVAYRISDYNLVGKVDTYKASVDWAIVPSVRVRGGYQRAIRAPSLGELYAPPRNQSANVGPTNTGGGDPCDALSRLRNPGSNPEAARVRQLCIDTGVAAGVVDIFRFVGSAVPAVATGNTDLIEETADTYTAGVVWQSEFDSPILSRLSTSLDYYDITVEDAIGSITALVGLNRCFNADGSSNPTYDPNNYYCGLTLRNSNGAIELQSQPTLNLASYKVAGFDLQTDWAVGLADIGLGDHGALSMNVVVSYLSSYEIQNLANAPFLDYVGTIGNAQIDSGAISFPEWKVSASLGYSIGPVSTTLMYRWYDAMSNFADVGLPTRTQPGVADRDYFDLSAKLRVFEKTELRAGIQNLFDTAPPEWTGNGSTDLGLYDLLQRRYYVGFKTSF